MSSSKKLTAFLAQKRKQRENGALFIFSMQPSAPTNTSTFTNAK